MDETPVNKSSDPSSDVSPTTLEALGFVDFPHQRSVHPKFRFWFVLSIVIFGLGIVLVVVIAAASDIPWFSLLVVVLASAATIYGAYFLGSSRRRVRSVAATHPELMPVEMLSAFFPTQDTQIPHELLEEAKRFVSDKWFGTSVRICEPAHAVYFAPISELFEPVPLNESDPYFVGLEQNAGRSGRVPAVEAHGGDSHSNKQRSAIFRNIRFGGGWIQLAIFGSIFLLEVWKTYGRQEIRPTLVLWGIAALGSLFGFGGRGAWTSGEKWSLLPGAAMIEKTSWRNSRVAKHAFRRATSALIVHQATKHIWSVFVGDATESATTQTTQREALMLLRAWLSPVSEETTRRLMEAAISD